MPEASDCDMVFVNRYRSPARPDATPTPATSAPRAKNPQHTIAQETGAERND